MLNTRVLSLASFDWNFSSLGAFMTALRLLSNADLLSSAARLIEEERRITLSVLEHLREIERRKAYSDLGYRSLFEYAVSHLRYSEGSASRRISAMYAVKEDPELGAKIEAGETSVSAVAKIHSTVRREEKFSGKKWEPEAKKKLFQELASLPSKEIELGLAAVAPQGILQEKTRAVTPDLHEVRIYLSGEELKALEELRAAYSHSMKEPGSNAELIRKLIGSSKEKLDSQRRASPLRSETASLSKGALRYVPRALQRAAFQRAGHACEERSGSGERCSSRYFLQVEHVVPFARGGTHELSNLQVLCRQHNLMRGIRSFGADRMRRG
jgi:hypothetical protein